MLSGPKPGLCLCAAGPDLLRPQTREEARTPAPRVSTLRI